MTQPHGFDKYRELAQYQLDQEREDEMLRLQKECSFIWTTKAGEPIGVIQSFIAARGSIWMTTTEKRVRVAAVRRDPRTCIIVSSAGTSWGTGKTVTYKGLTTVHAIDSPAVAGWLVRDFVTKMNGEGNQQRIEEMMKIIDIPERVALQFTPHKKISYDGDKMAVSTPGADGHFDNMYK